MTTVRISYDIEVDDDIAAEIRWLNENGVRTESSCSGHGKHSPSTLIRASSVEEARSLGYCPKIYLLASGESSGLFEIGLQGLELEMEEVITQPYADCVFSAGHVIGHPFDSIYLKLEGDSREGITLYLRPDEALTIIWLLSGVLWSKEESLCNDVR